MNRFEYANPGLLPNENYIRRDTGVRLYDGDIKVHMIYYSAQIEHSITSTFFNRQVLREVNWFLQAIDLYGEDLVIYHMATLVSCYYFVI